MSGRNIFADTRGAILVFVAAAMMVVMLVIAFAVDSSFAYSEQSRMQGAADNAARAAAQLKATMNTTATMVQNVGYAVAAANGYVNGKNATVTVNTNPTVSSNFNLTYGVEVIIAKTQGVIFDTILKSGSTYQQARALAAWDFSPCIVALNKSGGTADTLGSAGINIAGTAVVNAGCGIWSNWNGAYSIATNGGAQVFSAGYMANNRVTTTTTTTTGTGKSKVTTTTTSTNISDLSSDTGLYGPCNNATTPPSCVADATTNPPNINLDSGQWTSPTASLSDAIPTPAPATQSTACNNMNTINPGVYTGVFPPVGSGANGQCYLKSGIYYVDTFSMTNGNKLIQDYSTCTVNCGITIVVTNKTVNNPVSVQGGELDITPTSDNNSIYKGVSLYSLSTKGAALQGGFNSTCDGSLRPEQCGLGGIVAFPNSPLALSGGSSTSKNCVSYIADSVNLAGNVNIGSGCVAKTVNASAARTYKLVE